MSPPARILVIEDDRRIAAFLDRALSHVGYVVRLAADGNSGLMQADHEEPELVILDLMLPDLDGMDVARELRQEVWGDDFPGSSNVIEVTIGDLRRKLEQDDADRLIHTVRPVGYMLRSSTVSNGTA